MQDYQAALERLRTDAAEATLVRDLSMDHAKRELLTGLDGPKGAPNGRPLYGLPKRFQGLSSLGHYTDTPPQFVSDFNGYVV